jgi:hypothetical protein
VRDLVTAVVVAALAASALLALGNLGPDPGPSSATAAGRNETERAHAMEVAIAKPVPVATTVAGPTASGSSAATTPPTQPARSVAPVSTGASMTAPAAAPPPAPAQAIAAAPAAPQPAPAPASVAPIRWRRFTPPASIDTTGTRDVSRELQSFLNHVPHHAVITFPAGAKYRIERTLKVASRNDLRINGNGATFFATVPNLEGDNPRIRSQWEFKDISNLLVEDMIIRGAHPNGGQTPDAYIEQYEAQHGIAIHGGERIEVRNIRVTDVYGDFVYVGGSPFKVLGLPRNVWIHDNYFRRNGRQGVAVTAAFDVVIERNDIADTRRATFDLEPGTGSGSVRNVWIRNNKVGPGRLLFVAGHGGGDVSDIYIQDNVLTGHHMGIDMAAPGGMRRQNIVVTGNVSDSAIGNGRGAMLRFVGYDYLDIRNNVQRGQKDRDMYLVGTMRSCEVNVVNNDIGAYGAGQHKVLSAGYDCSKVPPLVRPTAPAVWAGQEMAIDVGGAGSFVMVPCPTTNNCGGFYTGGAATPMVAGPVTGAGTTMEYRTMLHGDLHFGVPIRSGTYSVTLYFVEPTDGKNLRRFHLDAERVRRESGFEVKKWAGGTNIVLRRRYDVTVGDGVLNIDTRPGGTGDYKALISLIKIERQ